MVYSQQGHSKFSNENVLQKEFYGFKFLNRETKY